MQCVWEQTGVLGPIYRLLGQGVDNKDVGAGIVHRRAAAQPWQLPRWVWYLRSFRTDPNLN